MTLDTLLARNIEGFVLKLSATRPKVVYVTIQKEGLREIERPPAA